MGSKYLNLFKSLASIQDNFRRFVGSLVALALDDILLKLNIIKLINTN